MRPVSPTLTYLGIAVVVAGFVVIMLAWGRVAGLTAVPLQMPYLLSGGLTGLGLILVGLTLININVKRQDASARTRSIGQLREVLAEIKALLAGEAAPASELPDATPEAPAADHTEPLPPISA
jgi:hypothetical protein